MKTVRALLETLWSHDRAIFFFRNVGAVVIALVACLVPELGPHRFWLAGFLVGVAIPIAVLLEWRYPVAENAWVQPMFDLGMVVTLVHLVPQAWFPALVLGLMVVQAPSVAESRSGHRLYALFAAILTVGMTLAAVVHDVPEWELPVLAMVAIYPSVIYYSYRQTQRSNRIREQASTMEGLRLVSGGVAHDFNNLLAAVMGNSELALDQLGRHRARPYVEDALKAAGRASLLSARLLAFTGRESAEEEDLDIVEETRELVSLLRSTVPKEVALDFRTDLERAVVRARRYQLQQILMNLVLNASEASEEKGFRVRIELDAASGAPGRERIRLRVVDDGIGIPASDQDRVFEPLFSLKEQGHGFGLASVKSAVADLGGEIRLESREGQGTRVEVLLPGRLEPEAAPSIEREDAPAPAAGHLALVVDDDDAVRRVLIRLLERAGCRAVEARRSSEAVEIFRAQADAIHIVFLDVRLPGPDGWECLAALRAIRPEIAAVVCTGHDPRHPTDRAADVPVLHKPFRAADLERVLEASLRRG